MKTFVCNIVLVVSLLLAPTTLAAGQHPPELLEEALYSVLFPQINKALQDHYGIQKKYDCPKLITIKKIYSGTYIFQASVEIIKYEQYPGGKPTPPFDRVTMTFDNVDGEWIIKSIEVQRLPDNTKVKCQN